MIHHWKGHDLEITNGECQFGRPYTGKTVSSQTLSLKHVEIIEVSDKPTYDSSFQRS